MHNSWGLQWQWQWLGLALRCTLAFTLHAGPAACPVISSQYANDRRWTAGGWAGRDSAGPLYRSVLLLVVVSIIFATALSLIGYKAKAW